MKVTSDISKMTRVKEVNTKKDETQLELNLRRKDMAPVRPEGPYPEDREWDRWTNILIKLTTKLKETPINQLFDYRPIKAVLDKLEALEASEHKVTSHVIDLKEEQIYNPHGEYSGMDVAKEKDSTVYQYNYGGRVETFNIKDMGTRDLDYWIMKFHKSRVELEGQDIPSYISPRLRQAEIDGMKSIEVELTRKLWERQALSADPHEWPVTTHCGSAGCPGQPKCSAAVPVPCGEATIDHMKCRGGEACGGATQEEKDAFEKDLQKRTIEEERKFQKTAGAMPDAVKDNRTMKLRWQEAIEQLTEELRCLPKEQLFNHPRIREVVSSILSTEEIIVPPMPDTYPSGQARYEAQNANYRKLYGSLPDPKLTIIPHYDAYAAQVKKQQKKIRRYKVMTVVSKVIIASLLIYIGLIIMENILAGKPISTFLARILGAE